MDRALILTGLGIVVTAIIARYAYLSNKKSVAIQELQTRPYLLLSIAKSEETGRYFDITEKDGHIIWTVSFIIENKGDTPANNIRLPQNVNLKDNTTVDEYMAVPIENISLGQGEKYRYTYELSGKVGNQSKVEEELNKFKTNNKPIELHFLVLYTGLIDEEKAYSSRGHFHIEPLKYSLLKDIDYQ